MNAKNDRAPRKPEETPLPKRRFRIEKLEERIAPKGGKSKNCGSHSNAASDTYGSFGSNY